MTEIMKYGWWVKEAGWPRESEFDETRNTNSEPEPTMMKTVMVYRLDKDSKTKEPLGILVERRRAERGNNVIGMVHRARKEFSETEPDSARITIGDYV